MTIEVYRASDLDQPLVAPVTTTGASRQFSLAGSLDSLRGETLLFRVTPKAGHLGDGIYTLQIFAGANLKQASDQITIRVGA